MMVNFADSVIMDPVFNKSKDNEDFEYFRDSEGRPISPLLRWHQGIDNSSFEDTSWIDWDWLEWLEANYRRNDKFASITKDDEVSWMLGWTPREPETA